MERDNLLRIGVLVATLALCLGARAQEQCEPRWLPGEDVAGVSGHVYAMTVWDVDGPGPAPALLVVGGTFTIAGGQFVNNIAAWNPATGAWSGLDSGLTLGAAFAPVAVYSLAVLPNGSGRYDLVAAGTFEQAGGQSAANIAKWDGRTWSRLSHGIGSASPTRVYALLPVPNGAGGADLVAGGSFNNAGGVTANHVARWNGSAWSAMGAGFNEQVRALAALPNASGGVDVIAGGWLHATGAVPLNSIARWDGTGWQPLGAGLNNMVHSLAVLQDGSGRSDLVAGGTFTTAGGIAANRIARWNGTAWSAFGPGLGAPSTPSGAVLSLFVLPNGDLIAGGEFRNAGQRATHGIARWSNGEWTPLGAGVTFGDQSSAAPHALALVPRATGEMDLIAGGSFLAAGEASVDHMARWDGSAWSAIGTSLNGRVLALATTQNGDLVVGGALTSVAGVPARRIARWNGRHWFPLGEGVRGGESTFAQVDAIAVATNDVLYAGGVFATAGEAPANNIARWNGATWSALGEGVNGEVHALTTLRNGEVVAGGSFTTAGGLPAAHIARWDGIAWSAFGQGTNGTVRCFAVLHNGDLVAGGEFTTVDGATTNHIARWDGIAWSALGSGTDASVWSLGVLANGDLVAGGYFTSAGGQPASYLARWNGAEWQSMQPGLTGIAYSFLPLPTGELLAGGAFVVAGSPPTRNIARWDGNAWAPVGSGTNRIVLALASLANGASAGGFVAGGLFTTAGGEISPYLARFASPCACPADLDDDALFDPAAPAGGAARDGAVTIDDLLFFLQAFDAAHLAADLDDGSGSASTPGHPDGAVSIHDLLFMLLRFEIGC